MKFMKNAQSLILCALTIGSTIQTEIFADSNHTNPALQQDPSEIALIMAFKQIQEIDTFIMQLALLISKGSIRGLSNPKGTIDILKEVRNLVGSLTKDQMAIIAMKDPNINEQYTAALTHICGELINYLVKGLNNKLKGLKPFDVASLAKRGLPKKPTRYGIQQIIQKNDTQIKSLKHTIDNVGLTWYNKIARKTDRYIISPAIKYHVPTISFYGGSATLVAGYSLWKFGKILENPNVFKPGGKPQTRLGSVTKFLYDRIGEPWHDSPRTGNAVPTGFDETDTSAIMQESGKIPFIEYTTLHLMANPLSVFAAGYFLNSFSQTQWPIISQAFTQKRDDFWNFLRGGQYMEQSSGMSFLEPTYTFDDMIGLDGVKKEFGTIIQYLENPELLANMHASPEKGWLLTGEKRTGKSFSFECLCGEIKRMQELTGQKNKFSFLNIDASIIHQEGIKKILAFAQYNAPMILFIDEIDLLNLNRVGDTKLLNEFLTGLQSSMNQDPSKIVIIIAATNKPQTLDPALRANGRFGKEIRFEYPAKKYRIECITRELTSMALDIEQFDIDRLAEKTDQKSIEDLRAIIRSAMTRAWMHGQPLTQQLLEESIDTEIHHIIMTDRKDLPESENRILASHFAGRALATLYLSMNLKLDKVTIHARMTDLTEEAQWADLYKDKNEKDKEKEIEHGHLTTRLINDSIHVKNEQEILNEAKSRIAGFIAEEILLGSCGFSCHPREHERAYRMIEQLVFEGLNPSLVSKQVSEQLKQKAFNLLQQCKAEVKELLMQHQMALNAIAEELLSKRILTDKEIQVIINKIETTVTTTESESTSELTNNTVDEKITTQETTADAESTGDKIETENNEYDNYDDTTIIEDETATIENDSTEFAPETTME